ncbi:hypothetical protein EYC80_007665 [Monilinia laxa]|uniref:Uncharacterized protein n=1 Tax=Monilinia laxa TaxID=61186 RepID=A0A5N6JWL7_MONLA|nr:hypothetical protein EYC80_007665 [Monilinia laxa]
MGKKKKKKARVRIKNRRFPVPDPRHYDDGDIQPRQEDGAADTTYMVHSGVYTLPVEVCASMIPLTLHLTYPPQVAKKFATPIGKHIIIHSVYPHPTSQYHIQTNQQALSWDHLTVQLAHYFLTEETPFFEAPPLHRDLSSLSMASEMNNQNKGHPSMSSFHSTNDTPSVTTINSRGHHALPFSAGDINRVHNLDLQTRPSYRKNLSYRLASMAPKGRMPALP